MEFRMILHFISRSFTVIITKHFVLLANIILVMLTRWKFTMKLKNMIRLVSHQSFVAFSSVIWILLFVPYMYIWSFC